MAGWNIYDLITGWWLKYIMFMNDISVVNGIINNGITMVYE